MTALLSDVSQGVLTLTLDGPDNRNAIDPELYRAIAAAVIGASDTPDVRAIVLTGAQGYFCSGGNIKVLQDTAAGPRAQAFANTDALNAMIRAVHDSPLPVIAAIEGGAAGAGATLALACDLIIAAEGAKLAVTYVKIGLTPDGGITHFLRSALPRQLVSEMCLLARPVSAQRLAEFGVVNEVVPEGAALPRAQAIARELAQGPRDAQAIIKHEIGTAPANDLATHQQLEAEGINRARFGAEATEGLAAFLAKRNPGFS